MFMYSVITFIVGSWCICNTAQFFFPFSITFFFKNIGFFASTRFIYKFLSKKVFIKLMIIEAE